MTKHKPILTTYEKALKLRDKISKSSIKTPYDPKITIARAKQVLKSDPLEIVHTYPRTFKIQDNCITMNYDLC